MIKVNGEAKGRGSPKLTWMTVVKNDMVIMNEVEHIALDMLNGKIGFVLLTPSNWKG